MFASAAVAQEFPELFDVANVAADDVLNVRTDPHAGTEIVGTLPYNGTNIEVIKASKDGKWAFVNIGEISGWVSLRYLAAVPPEADLPLRRRISCFGTEPFWSLAITQGNDALFERMGDAPITFDIDGLQRAQGFTDRYGVALANAGVALIRREVCDDGMSDRLYGLSVEVGMTDGGLTLFSGCCSLAP
ncbi:MAG: COG3650 family protein [Paracoccaceae bacterium]